MGFVSFGDIKKFIKYISKSSWANTKKALDKSF